jgi:hypothetical protein
VDFVAKGQELTKRRLGSDDVSANSRSATPRTQAIRPSSGFVQEHKHGINPPLVARHGVEQHPTFELRIVRTCFNHFAFYEAAYSNMPIEHPPISNTDVWLTANDVHEICERLGAPQH